MRRWMKYVQNSPDSGWRQTGRLPGRTLSGTQVDIADDVEQVNRIHIYGRAHSSGADIQILKFIHLFPDPSDVPSNHSSIRLKGLPQPDGDRILKLGPSHLNHIVKLNGLLMEGFLQTFQFIQKAGQQARMVSLPAQGITSLVDWAMFTWSLGWTRE